MKASERLHIAQPALSVRLANLEAELGVKLVERSHRGVELTKEGHMLYEHANSLLKYHDVAIKALRTRKVKPVGSVSVGVPSTLSARLAAPLHSAINAELPDVSIYFLEASTPALYEWLQSGKIDFAVLFSVPEEVGFEISPLYMEDFFLVGPPDTNSDLEIAFDAIFDYPLVLPRQTTTWRKILDKAAENVGKSLNCTFETESLAAMRAIIISGESYTILPKSSIIEDDMQGRVHARRIVNPQIRGLLSISNLQTTELSFAHREVRDIIIRIAREFGDAGESKMTDFYSQKLLPSSLFARLFTPSPKTPSKID